VTEEDEMDVADRRDADGEAIEDGAPVQVALADGTGLAGRLVAPRTPREPLAIRVALRGVREKATVVLPRGAVIWRTLTDEVAE
jgi:hypothetical protein